jgi:hypothetical protein
MFAALMLCMSLSLTPFETADALTVFIGDSRTVQMDRAVADSACEVYIAKGSTGYEYLESTAWPEFEKVVSDNPGTTINAVIGYGINDLWKESMYADFVNSKVELLPSNVHLSWVSVNPVLGEYSKMSSRINWFNENIRNDLDERISFIDSYSYLMDTGFSSYDGLHYVGATNVDIHDFLLECLNETGDADKEPETEVIVCGPHKDFIIAQAVK